MGQLTLTQYQKLAQRTANPNVRLFDKYENGLFGLVGEAGELLDHYKKVRFQGHPFDEEKAAEELGDLLWYVAEAAAAIGYDLGSIAAGNIEKLEKRYPNGFDPNRSINRSAIPTEEENCIQG